MTLFQVSAILDDIDYPKVKELLQQNALATWEYDGGHWLVVSEQRAGEWWIKALNACVPGGQPGFSVLPVDVRTVSGYGARLPAEMRDFLHGHFKDLFQSAA